MDQILPITSVDSLGDGPVPASPQVSSRSAMGESHRRAGPKDRVLTKTTSFKIKNRWEQVDHGEQADALVVALKAERRGKEIDKKDVEKVLLEQYPGVMVRPTYLDMDKSIDISPGNGLLFGTGQWAEYYGGDAKWHLGLIRRVLAKAPLNHRPSTKEEPKWEYSYSFGKGIDVPPYLVRAPEEALKRRFGMRPFVFIQWALLRVETTTRFQEHHQRDFEVFNFQYAAETMWNQFLNHSDNADFKIHFESSDEVAQTKLLQHVLSPFAGIDRLSKLNSPGARWDFKTQNISVYTYPSLLGTGWLTCISILMLQVAIPGLLLTAAVENSPRFDGPFETSTERFCPSTHGPTIDLMRSSGVLEGLLMNILVLVLYTFRVAPHILDTFYQTTGEGGTPASRLNALRAVVWNQGTDTLSQQFGYRLERLVKSVYICLVIGVMMFVLFLSSSVLDIILNALALEFVWQMDIEYARSPYWDPKRRYIKAGAVECRIRAALDLNALKNPLRFCATYDIDPSDYKAVFNGYMPSLRSKRVSEADAANPDYMSETDVIWKMASEVAQSKGLGNAMWQFSQHLSGFSVFEHFLVKASWSTPIFGRFRSYRTWSLWEEVLFLPPVPSKGDLASYPGVLASTYEERRLHSPQGRASVIAELHEMDEKPFGLQVRGNNSEYLNFSPEYNLYTPSERFYWHVLDTLRLVELWRSMVVAANKRDYWEIPFRLLDGAIEWLSHIIQLLFPLTLLGFMVLNILCY